MTILLHLSHCLASGELARDLGRVPSIKAILFLDDKDTIMLFLQQLKLELKNRTTTRGRPGISEELIKSGLGILGVNSKTSPSGATTNIIINWSHSKIEQLTDRDIQTSIMQIRKGTKIPDFLATGRRTTVKNKTNNENK